MISESESKTPDTVNAESLDEKKLPDAASPLSVAEFPKKDSPAVPVEAKSSTPTPDVAEPEMTGTIDSFLVDGEKVSINLKIMLTAEEVKKLYASLPVSLPSSEADFAYPVCHVKLRQRQRIPAVAELVEFLEQKSFEWAFHYQSGKAPGVMMISDPVASPVWFIGDLHGDLLALNKVVTYMDLQTQDSVFVFLGDIFDRNSYSMEVISVLLGLIKDRPGKILWLAGNHDIGLQYDSENRRFCADVEPAEFADYLNAHPELEQFGKLLIEFMKTLPRAIFFPDGLIVSHGGVPHMDLLDSIKSIEDLNQTQMLSDFTWNRITRNEKKRPNRNSKGNEIGRQNFVDFCNKVAEISQLKPQRIVCAHQHPRNGWQIYPSYNENQAVCINSTFLRDPFPGESLYGIPCVAKYRNGKIPEIHAIEMDEMEITTFYQPENNSVETAKS